MLPLYDAKLDTQAYNIFQPLDKILPYDLPTLFVTTTTESNQLSVKSATTKSETIDTYCRACKKKFINGSTYTNHLKSAKHIVNEKKVQPATKLASSPAQKIIVNPQVQEALKQLDQAQDPRTDPNTSITIYWSQAQLLYALKRPQYVEKALTSLINLLVTTSTTSFSSAQLTSLLYNSRLALARLLCIYQALQESRSVYLDALGGKWKLEKSGLLDISKNIRHLSVDSLLKSCDLWSTKYLTRERNRTRPAPALIDPNNSITAVLYEAGNLFAQKNNNYESLPSEHIAIVLYATCALVCPYEKIGGYLTADFYFMMHQVYESLDLVHRVIEVRLLDKTDTWSTFIALILSLEIDDLVRAKEICKKLQTEKAYLYPDVKLLCDLCESKTTLDSSNVKEELDYTKLLLKETDERMLIRERSQKEQLNVLDRITDLIIQFIV